MHQTWTNCGSSSDVQSVHEFMPTTSYAHFRLPFIAVSRHIPAPVRPDDSVTGMSCHWRLHADSSVVPVTLCADNEDDVGIYAFVPCSAVQLKRVTRVVWSVENTKISLCHRQLTVLIMSTDVTWFDMGVAKCCDHCGHCSYRVQVVTLSYGSNDVWCAVVITPCEFSTWMMR